jgi:hypothetical protein
MTLKKTKLQYLFFSLAFLIISGVLFSSCESSRVGPTVPTPNPNPPTKQALLLNGNVKDASNQVAISGASVTIVRTDGTIITTLLSDNSGKYSFDASNITASTVNISATKSGYAYGIRVAKINQTANTASVSDILLTRLQASTATVTVAAGGTASTTNTQSLAGQSLTVQVPANAVSSNIQLSVSSVPAGQLPQPTDLNTAIVSAGQFGPSGTQFTQPITISFPLPYNQTPGTTYALMQLNEQTGAYTNSGFTATVNPDGTSASAAVTHFTTYTLQEGVTYSTNTPTTSSGTDQYVTLTSGSTTKSLSIINAVAMTGSGTVNEDWLKDEVAGKLGFSIGSSTQTLTFSMQALPSQYIQNGVQIGPTGHESEKGNWEYRVFYALQTTTTTGSATGPSWNRNVTATTQSWEITSQGWYWISHDQGGAVFGPF